MTQPGNEEALFCNAPYPTWGQAFMLLKCMWRYV